MKIFIEDYKGQVINYDDDADKFVCDISIEDRSKSSKRGSLKDIRKEIDLFIKENLDFKPFKVLVKSYDDFSIGDVESIRTDGKLVVKNSGSYKSYYDKKDSAKLCKYDYDLVKSMEELETLRNEFFEKFKTQKSALFKRLSPLDLSMYPLK